VRDENDSVDAFQNELPASIVKHLARHRVEVESGFEATDLAKGKWQKVEEKGALSLSSKTDHLPLRVRIGTFVDELQVRGFPAESRPIVDNFAIDLPGHVVDETHARFL